MERHMTDADAPGSDVSGSDVSGSDVSEADMADQRRPVLDDAPPEWPRLPPEVPEADAIDQALVAPLDDDEERR